MAFAKDIALTAALRSNLLSLQGTQRLLDQTQLRLATGLKVNSALDDPNAFFAARSLNDRAGDLSRRLDGMGQAIQVLKAADDGISALTELLEQGQALAQEARDLLAADAGADVASLGTAFQSIMAQVDFLVADTGYRGTNLLDGGTLNVIFDEDGDSTFAVTGVDFSVGGGTLTTASVATWANTGAADATLGQITDDLTLIRAQARVFGTNLTTIQTRQDFTVNLINTLKEGADKLTLADKNEEGARMLSLQTAQQLGITSLSLASQANQSILRLFG